MSVGKAIFDILSNDAPIGAIIGDRIYPSRVPYNGSFPAVAYHIVSTNPNGTKNGISTYDYVTVQISAYAEKYTDVKDLEDLIRRAFDYNSGTYAGVVIDKSFFQGAIDLHDDSYGEDGIYQVSMDFRFNLNV